MTPADGRRPCIAYVAHDLNDSAVHRRIAMFQAGGVDVVLLGLHRGPAPDRVMGLAPTSLGQTTDGDLRGRAISVLKALLSLGRWTKRLADADVVVARNLETLLLAGAARLLRRAPPYLYEMLDVHTVMTGAGLPSRLMRGLEGLLVRRALGVMVSSPAFVSQYLQKAHAKLPRVHLVENKVFGLSEGDQPVERATLAEPPWRIGWFGNLRCLVSLETLVELARTLGPRVEIHLRGTIAISIKDVFATRTAGLDNVHYHGRYQNPADLAEIYAGVDFVWAIDFYEAGLNSTWLLPNRLYEGCAFGAVPIAVAGVETSTWLEQHKLGVVLPQLTDITPVVTGMTVEKYAGYAAAVRSAPRGLLVATQQDCKEFVAVIMADAATDKR